MSVLCVPELEPRGREWPTLGPQVVEFLTGLRPDGAESERYPGSVFGPGSLKGTPYRMDAEKIAATYRAYEINPPEHTLGGRRRFKRVGISWRKGTAKTEWAAQIVYAELHPEGPVRFNGWERTKTGEIKRDPFTGAAIPALAKAVRDPYIPMVAYTEDQAEELAYGALMVIVGEGHDADMFDVALGRIVRLDERGYPDGKAQALSGSPNANDGARTTCEHFDETHRMELPRLIAAHETMLNNLPKRALEDPWCLETTTAGRPGAGSVAEQTHIEAQKIAEGKINAPDLWYFHREASAVHNLGTMDGRIAAISEATGPVGEYGPGQFHDIAKQWDRPHADTSYLERVWLNRWTRSDLQAYDVNRFQTLRVREDGAFVETLPDRAFVTVGFDGAVFKDATGLVLTDIPTGRQMPYVVWERDEGDPDWEVPIDEVNDVCDEIFKKFDVWQLWADPPHFRETVAAWGTKHPDHVVEWWTNRRRPMHEAAKAFKEAIDTESLEIVGSDEMVETYTRHVGNAGKVDINLHDENGNKLWILGKIKPELKFDLCMAGVISYAARLEALKKNAKPSAAQFVPYRIR